MLIVGRIVQSGGGAAGMVIARAIVRDLYAREQAASMIAYLTMAMVVAPMLAPSIGALLLDLFDWHAIFIAVTGVGLLLVWRAQQRLPETRAGGSGAAGWSAFCRGPQRSCARRAFIAYVLQSTFAISVFFAFVAGAPYYMIDILDRPATEYGLWFIVVSLGFMAGNFLTARLGRRIGLDRMVLLGSCLVLLGIVLAAGLTVGGLWTPIALFGPMMLATFGNGLVDPQRPGGRHQRRSAAGRDRLGPVRLHPDAGRRPGQPGGRHAAERHALPDAGLHGRLRRDLAARVSCCRVGSPASRRPGTPARRPGTPARMASGAPAAAGSAVTPVSPAFMALLVGMTALAPLSMQIFVPALPAIQRGFQVSTGVAQLALSLSILANALATLSYGPLSDRFGRRPAVLAGLGLFVVGSVMCALAPTIDLLIVGRVVQAAGGAAGMVMARAIVRDLYEREHAAAMIAYLTMAMVVAPMLAPSVGAVLMDLSDWRAIFVALTVVGILLVWGARLRLIETRAGAALGSGARSLMTGAGRLLRSDAFIAYVLQSTFSMSMFFAFVSGAPYFVIDVLERPATEYGLYFILVSVGYMAGNFTAARVTRRVGLDRMIVLGSSLALVVAALVLGLLLTLPWAPVLLFGPMMLGSFASGLAMPNAQAGAISVDPALAGTASGVAGFTQLLVAALVSQAVGMLQDGTPYPMLGFMVGCAAALAAGLPAAAAALACR